MTKTQPIHVWCRARVIISPYPCIFHVALELSIYFWKVLSLLSSNVLVFWIISASDLPSWWHVCVALKRKWKLKRIISIVEKKRPTHLTPFSCIFSNLLSTTVAFYFVQLTTILFKFVLLVQWVFIMYGIYFSWFNLYGFVDECANIKK